MLIEVNSSNKHVLNNLLQAYEAEFSVITMKKPNNDGIFELDTELGGSIHGYIWGESQTPAGFILFDLANEPYNVNEFYIVPSFRGNKIGKKFFQEVLEKHPGSWQVKQLPNAIAAKAFWVAIIKDIAKGKFTDEVYIDKYWGKVSRQVFNYKKLN